MNLRTSYYDYRGIEIFDSKLIAIDYLTSLRFYTDVASFIPFDRIYYTPGNALKAVGIFKINRLGRLT